MALSSAESVSQLQDAILAWYQRQRRDLPWRNTRDPYAVLVAEIMLQQTQVDRVVPKYHEFLDAFPTLQALAGAPTAEVIRRWHGLGYNRRAVNLQAAAREAVERFGGTLPADENALLGLPGIGRYTAAAVACFAFEQRVPLVDTNVRRVLGRVFGRPEPVSSRDAWELAGLALPEDAYSWNQALMDLGATICTSRNPACLLCPAFTGCATRGGGRQIAERRAPYKTERFEGSNRYYRGRVVTALRALAPGDGLALDALGAAIRAGYSDEHRPWIETLVAALEADRLVRLHDGLVSLP